MLKASFEFFGELVIEKINDDGTKTRLVHKKNLVVTAGKAMGTSRLFSNTVYTVMSAIGVGTSSTAPALTDTALGGQLARLAFDAAFTQTANTASVTTTFPAGSATGTWAEAGLFSAVSGGTMFSRTTFTAIPKGASDVIAVTWNVTAS